jgi:uncharacterized membrane protein YccC
LCHIDRRRLRARIGGHRIGSPLGLVVKNAVLAPEIGLTALGGAVALVIGGVLVARGKRAKAPPPSERSR